MIERTEKQILVAGVGNIFLQDDGFGAEVARRLEAHGVPSGVTVLDFGTGGLKLAHEVMRGYDALVLVDISRQGGEPGTLYVMEPEPESVDGGLQEGDAVNPHGMDPRTVLRFVKAVGGWPGKVVVIACEPAAVGEMDMSIGLSGPVTRALDDAVALVLKTVEELGSDAAYQR